MSAGAPTLLEQACGLTREMLASAAAGDLEALAGLEARRRTLIGRADAAIAPGAEGMRELHDLNEKLIESLRALRRNLCADWDSVRRARAAMLGYGRVARDG